MNRSYTTASMRAASLGAALALGLPSVFIMLYGLFDGSTVLIVLGVLGLLGVGRIYHLQHQTGRSPGTVADTVITELAQDPRFPKIAEAEQVRRVRLRNILLWGPFLIVFVLFLTWASIPVFKTVLVYIPAILPKITGTM